MKKIESKSFRKVAYPSYDDLPNSGILNRDNTGEGETIYQNQVSDSKEDIIKRWKKKIKPKKVEEKDKFPKGSL